MFDDSEAMLMLPFATSTNMFDELPKAYVNICMLGLRVMGSNGCITTHYSHEVTSSYEPITTEVIGCNGLITTVVNYY